MTIATLACKYAHLLSQHLMTRVCEHMVTCTALARVAAGAEDEHGMTVGDDLRHERQQLVLRRELCSARSQRRRARSAEQAPMITGRYGFISCSWPRQDTKQGVEGAQQRRTTSLLALVGRSRTGTSPSAGSAGICASTCGTPLLRSTHWVVGHRASGQTSSFPSQTSTGFPRL